MPEFIDVGCLPLNGNWGWVLGPIGKILSVTMTCLVKIALESYEKTRGFAIILGSGEKIE
jgi:predicted PurR-regulated permease PerM